MDKYNILSDQLTTWSDYHGKLFNKRTEKKKKRAFEKVAESGTYRERFINRAVQTMWKTRMQMCQRKGAWPQILSVYQSDWEKTQNGLHTTGYERKGCKISTKLSIIKRDFGRNLQNQSRTYSAQSTVLEGKDGYSTIFRRKMVFRYL